MSKCVGTTGGPAFTLDGMSSRDYFAAAALPALIAAGHDMPTAVRLSFETADAMIQHSDETRPKPDDMPW